MGKTRERFKKIGDTKGTFHAKMGSIKDRNGMDLTEAEDTKKRWQEYTEELCKKDLHDPDNHMFKLDLEKAKEQLIKLPTFTGSLKKQESSRKTSISALWTMPNL